MTYDRSFDPFTATKAQLLAFLGRKRRANDTVDGLRDEAETILGRLLAEDEAAEAARKAIEEAEAQAKQADEPALLPAGAARNAAARTEHAAELAWLKAGSDPATKPATPNLDAVRGLTPPSGPATKATVRAGEKDDPARSFYWLGRETYTCQGEGSCGETKPVEAFPVASRQPNLRRRLCRSCRSARRAAGRDAAAPATADVA